MELFIGGGIILIYLGIVIACVFWALAWAARKQLSVRGKTGTVLGVLFLAYAIPFGDHTIGYIKFKRLCEEQAGEKIVQSLHGVKGFLWGNGRQTKPYTTYGYSFYETTGKGNQVFRYVRLEDGSIVEESYNSSNAKFVVGRTARVKLESDFSKSEFFIDIIGTNERIAIHSRIDFEGGWLVKSLKGIGVHGPMCPEEPLDHLRFIRSVLIPNESKE